MGNDYGHGDPVDIAVGVYALRTFAVTDGRLSSVVVGAGHWDNGICVARCVGSEDPDHKAPTDGCNCGIYGAFSVGALFAQYGEHACRIVAVIAAEGPTLVGDTGLRTSAARVVSYWCSDRISTDADICARQCPGARRFFDLRVMARIYRLC